MSYMTSGHFGSPRDLISCCNIYPCYFDTVEIWGSSPHGPTIPRWFAMAFVYILQSETTGRFYIGSTDDLERRLAEHLRGHSPATRGRGPGNLSIRSNSTLLLKAAAVNTKLSDGNRPS